MTLEILLKEIQDLLNKETKEYNDLVLRKKVQKLLNAITQNR